MSWWFVCLVASVGYGCAVEEPYSGWAPPPSSPVSVEDVLTLLGVGVPEEAIFTRVRSEGVLSRPSAAEIRALREIGASEGLIAGLLAAAVPPMPWDPSEDLPNYVWPALHEFLGHPPFLCWTWVGGRPHLVFPPRGIEP